MVLYVNNVFFYIYMVYLSLGLTGLCYQAAQKFLGIFLIIQ